METNAMLGLAAAIAMFGSTIFPALSQGNTASKAMESMARQPEASGEIRTAMILALAFMEALTIYGLLIAIMLLGKMG